MQLIDPLTFQKKISQAQIICAPEFGHYINFDKKSPFESVPFQIPDGTELFLSSHHFGDVLKLMKNGRVVLLAFLFDPEFLPVF